MLKQLTIIITGLQEYCNKSLIRTAVPACILYAAATGFIIIIKRVNKMTYHNINFIFYQAINVLIAVLTNPL